jgi:integrase/recombinase XerC
MQHSRTSPKVLTSTEQLRLLRETGRHPGDLRDHLIFSLALGCGLRLSEIVGLDIGDVRNGKGIKGIIHLRAAITKGGKAADIALPERLRRKLSRFCRWKTEQGQALHPSSPLLISRGGGRSRTQAGARLSRRAVQSAFASWQKRLGFDRHCNFHALRHTFVTNLWRATRDLRLVQMAARHSSPSVTAIYAHPSLDDLLEAVQDLPC